MCQINMLQKRILYIIYQTICLAYLEGPLQSTNNPKSLWQLFWERNNDNNLKLFHHFSFQYIIHLQQNNLIQATGLDFPGFLVKLKKPLKISSQLELPNWRYHVLK